MFPPPIAAVMARVDALRHEVDDHWQIPLDEALFLAQLVRLGQCRSILEIGTSYGFSTLHLAAAAQQTGGRVTTLDLNPKKTTAATEHLRQAGLLELVTLLTGDARELLPGLRPEAAYDFAFIDATKEQSDAYLDGLLPHLAPRAVLVTDNTSTHATALAPFVARLRDLPGATSCHVPIGNGVELTLLQR